MKKILYVHIPKAGGSAVNQYFTERLGKDNCLLHAENLLSDKTADHSTADTRRFVSAHLVYPRLHQHFSGQQRFVMTVLRSPLEQLVSHLAWVRYQTDIRQKMAFASLPEFVQQLARRLAKVNISNPRVLEKFLGELEPRELAFFDNCQTRYMVAYVNGPLAPGVVARAKRNMQAFDFVGIAERMPDVFDFLSWRFRLIPADGSVMVNRSRQKYGLDTSDPALCEVLRPYCAFDQEIYAYAKRLFAIKIYEMWLELSRQDASIINHGAIHQQLRRRCRASE